MCFPSLDDDEQGVGSIGECVAGMCFPAGSEDLFQCVIVHFAWLGFLFGLVVVAYILLSQEDYCVIRSGRCRRRRRTSEGDWTELKGGGMWSLRRRIAPSR